MKDSKQRKWVYEQFLQLEKTASRVAKRHAVASKLCSRKTWKGSKQGEDAFAEDTNVNNTAAIKANYTEGSHGIEDWARRWQMKCSSGRGTSIGVYMQTLNLHKFAHRFKSVNQALPLTIVILEFCWQYCESITHCLQEVTKGMWKIRNS